MPDGTGFDPWFLERNRSFTVAAPPHGVTDYTLRGLSALVGVVRAGIDLVLTLRGGLMREQFRS